MKSSFHSNLISSPFDDPCLYIKIVRENRAILFDLGSNYSLEPSKLLKVSDIFVSHTHIDHFIGFDNMLRLFLGREKMLRLFGPPGIISNVEGKLRAYTWNLVSDYPFVMEVKEVSEDSIKSSRFICRDKFRREDIEVDSPFKGILLNEQSFKISAVHLDHLIPSMAFSFSEDFHINIKKDALLKYGLTAGHWLSELKKHIREGKPDDFEIKTELEDREKIFKLKELKDNIVLISKGQKVAYVVDAVYSKENAEKIISLAQGADVFYCEATFLEEDIERAREKYHLTAREVGELARMAGVKRLEIFHFSPRYKYREELLYREAMAEFGKV